MDVDSLSAINDVNRFSRCTIAAARVPLSKIVFSKTLGSLSTSSSLIGSGLGIPVGMSMVYDSSKKYRIASECNDTAGQLEHVAMGIVGGSVVGSSVFLGAEAITEIQGLPVPPSVHLAFEGVGLVCGLVISAVAARGLYQGFSWKNELHSHLKQGGEWGVIKWLKDQVEPTEKEREESSQGLNELDPQIASRIQSSRLKKLHQKKLNVLGVKIAPSYVKIILKDLPGILKNKNLQEARVLIEKIQVGNIKKVIKYELLFLIGIISIVGSIAAFFLTGPIVPILFAVGAAVSLTVDAPQLYDWICRSTSKYFEGGGLENRERVYQPV